MEILSRLQMWYVVQCNGDWEHSSGITITSLDNPGWLVKIDLEGTALDNKEFRTILKNASPEFLEQAMEKVQPPYTAAEPLVKDDWMVCFIHNRKFEGAGDPAKLEKILSIFLDWAAD